MIGGIVAAVAVIGVLFAIFSGGNKSPNTASATDYQAGDPGPGKAAPEIRLGSTTGGTYDLAAQRGQTVLLYFQEGLTCQPCWDQLVAIDHDLGAFRSLNVNQVVSITSDPLGALRQKVSDEGITSPVLSDPGLSVSGAYAANQYGMMGTSRDGHTFIVVGPDGTIRWRADFGGAPNYTMNVPLPKLLADLRAGLAGRAG